MTESGALDRIEFNISADDVESAPLIAPDNSVVRMVSLQELQRATVTIPHEWPAGTLRAPETWLPALAQMFAGSRRAGSHLARDSSILGLTVVADPASMYLDIQITLPLPLPRAKNVRRA
jgi:hypothetical protein